MVDTVVLRSCVARPLLSFAVFFRRALLLPWRWILRLVPAFGPGRERARRTGSLTECEPELAARAGRHRGPGRGRGVGGSVAGWPARSGRGRRRGGRRGGAGAGPGRPRRAGGDAGPPGRRDRVPAALPGGP